MSTLRYRFNSEDHIHLLHRNGKEFPLLGTSTVVGVMNKPGLTYWASGLSCEALGWRNPKKASPEECLQAAEEALNRIKGMDGSSWHNELCKAYKAHATSLKKAASKGTDLHAELEAFAKDQMAGKTSPYSPLIEPFVRWAGENVKEWLWSEAHVYSEGLWCGGITDLGVTLKDGGTAVVDFKSSERAYASAFVQASGYAIQIEENGLFDADGNQIKRPDEIPPIDTLIIVPFRSNPVTPSVVKGIGKFREGFRSCVQLHKLVEGIQV